MYISNDSNFEEYAILEEDFNDLSKDLLKLFTMPDISHPLKCDCIHSGSCRFEQIILETKEICRRKE